MSDEKLDTVVPQYSAAVSAKKGVVEGGSSAAIVVAVAAIIVEFVKANNPDVSIGTAEVSLLLGAASGLLVGGFKALRNWMKNRNKTT
jgi:hypothetical protein